MGIYTEIAGHIEVILNELKTWESSS